MKLERSLGSYAIADPKLPATQSTASSDVLSLPAIHSFRPFFTRQPNVTTLASQLRHWSTIIVRYCAHNHVFSLTSADLTPNFVLFHNPEIRKRCSQDFISHIVSHLLSIGLAQSRTTVGEAGSTSQPSTSEGIYMWWKSANEWATLVENWVESTAQRGSVFTIYELREGDLVLGREWKNMPKEMFAKVVEELVRRKRAAVFGEEGDEGTGRGIKFFA